MTGSIKSRRKLPAGKRQGRRNNGSAETDKKMSETHWNRCGQLKLNWRKGYDTGLFISLKDV